MVGWEVRSRCQHDLQGSLGALTLEGSIQGHSAGSGEGKELGASSLTETLCTGKIAKSEVF